MLLWASACPAYDATLSSGGGKIQVFVDDGKFKLPLPQIEAWIQRSSDIVSEYFGRFPVDEAFVGVTGRDGKGVLGGIALAAGSAVVNVRLGLATDEADLADDWVLVHELAHLAFPKVHSRHHWAEEGLAVYVESVSRVQAGALDVNTMWRQFVDGMPNGLPAEGDRGLDSTPTWGRTYWGGTLFYLLADVEIIRRTGGSKTLRDGLRGIVAAGYSITDSVALERIYHAADRSVGVPVLIENYEKLGVRRGDVDLGTLWRKLGITRTASGVVLDDDAEWSHIRERIKRPAAP